MVALLPPTAPPGLADIPLDPGLRILMRTATSRDALMASSVLQRAGFATLSCADLPQMVQAMEGGAAALLVAEEVLGDAGLDVLARALGRQPAWSDIPVLILARQGANSRALVGAMDVLGNLTVLERPMRVASLVSALRTAVRARKRQYELRGVLQDLQLGDQRKDEFLATLAHELRNPMAPISFALSVLKRKAPTPEAAKPYYDMMARQLDHMVRLVNDLMEVSRITRGKIELVRELLSIDEVLGDALELSRPLLDARQHTLQRPPSAAPWVVMGDKVRLAQVFSNLLDNAAKYTPKGGQITLNVQQRGSEVVVSVRDSGAGIEAEMLDAVFDMFVQVSGTAKAAQGGLGIGLTLVKNLVELHNGHIHAYSDGLNQGSLFEVHLPLAQVGAPQAPTAAESLPLGAHNILVVDDNEDAANALSDLLTLMGMHVSVAYNGPDALALAEQTPPSAAILDIGMPGMDGCELATRLRAHPQHQHMVLIALTGWGQQQHRDRITEAGFQYHLLKPVQLEHLHLALARIAEGKG